MAASEVVTSGLSAITIDFDIYVSKYVFAL